MATEDNSFDDEKFDSTRKKKSKKRINRDALPEATPVLIEDTVTGGETTDDGDFSYEYLITRAFDVIHKTNPDLDLEHQMKIILPPPQLARIGTKRTSFINFNAMCKLLKRPEKLLYDYFVVELGTTASIDSKHALIIKARLGQKQIEKILCSFIREYVTCKTCRSPDTLLKKEERLTVIICNTCHSQYTVSNIKTGFQAQIGKRPKDT